jgi:hypothetical protein
MTQTLANVLFLSQEPELETRDFIIAGQKIRVFATAALLFLSTEALWHLAPFEGQPDLQIHLRDQLPNLEALDCTNLVRLDRFDPHGLQLLDTLSGVALWYVQTPLATHQQCAPMLHFLRFWLEQYQVTVLHAAAVATRDQAVLLVGRGGSGKSTTALLALEAGLDYLGDDYCAVSFDPNPVVHSLYSSTKFHFDNAHRVSFLEKRTNPDLEKGYAMLFNNYQKQLIPQATVRAILLPTLATRLEITPVSSQTALLALAPNTLLQLGSSQVALSQIGQLLRNLPCYRLGLGQNPSAVAATIRKFLEDV